MVAVTHFTRGELGLNAHLILERVKSHRRTQGETALDDWENAMPPKLNCSGNQALKDNRLIQAWRDYLSRYLLSRQIEIIEKETAGLDWSQNQRAEFIGRDKAQYSREKRKIRRN
jgi:hypothetical protein